MVFIVFIAQSQTLGGIAMLKRLNTILFLILLMALALSVSAFASGEPSGEPSAEPIEEASGEPSAEPAEEAELPGFDVTIKVNGDEYTTVTIGASVEGNVYTFQIAQLLEVLGANLVYDEQTDVATLTAEPNSLMSVFLAQLEADKESAASGEPGASDEPAASGEPSGEPGASDEPAAIIEPSGEPAMEAAASTPLTAQRKR